MGLSKTMKRMVEVTLDEATLTELGIPLDDFDYGLDDLSPDPQADHYGAMMTMYDTAPEDRGSMRSAIDRVMGIRHRLAELQAEEHRALARLSVLAREGVELFIRPGENEHKAREIAHRTMVAELAMVARVSSRTMDGRIAEAELISSRFPFTLEELAVGSISTGHVRVIMQYGLPLLDDEVRAEYEIGRA